MNQIRMLLAGTCSGIREIITSVVADSEGVELTEILSGPAVDKGMIISSIESYEIDAVILDLDDTGSKDRNLACGNSKFHPQTIAEIVQFVLDQYPNVIVVELKTLGRQLLLHSSLHVNNAGLGQLLELIKVACDRSGTM